MKLAQRRKELGFSFQPNSMSCYPRSDLGVTGYFILYLRLSSVSLTSLPARHEQNQLIN
jgi:hypothetical protein